VVGPLRVSAGGPAARDGADRYWTTRREQRQPAPPSNSRAIHST